jgi:hypothetical protein
MNTTVSRRTLSLFLIITTKWSDRRPGGSLPRLVRRWFHSPGFTVAIISRNLRTASL